MPLEDDSRYLLSERMKRHVKAELEALWPGSVVEFLKKPGPGVADVLDQEFGIDGELTTAHGLCLTFQFKVREYKWLPKGEFTIEMFNDPRGEQPGEWFNLTADLYFYGYANGDETGLADWYVFKIIDLKLAIESGEVQWGPLIGNRVHSRALFTTVPWATMPNVALVACCPDPKREPWG